MMFMRRCITYFVLFYSSQLMANIINYDEIFFTSDSTLQGLLSKTEKVVSFNLSSNENSFEVPNKSQETFLKHYDVTYNSFLSYDKILLNNFLSVRGKENHDLQHYIHIRQTNFLSKNESTWITSGAGVTLFESNNLAFEDKKTLSLSLGLHSNLYDSDSIKLNFSSKVFANYLDNNSQNCNDITCSLSNDKKMWIQKNVAINLRMIF